MNEPMTYLGHLHGNISVHATIGSSSASGPSHVASHDTDGSRFLESKSIHDIFGIGNGRRERDFDVMSAPQVRNDMR